MAAAKESQGLKIAVVALITLVVILTVSSYFLFSNGQSAQARLESAEEAKGQAVKAQNLAMNWYDTMRTRIGVTAGDYDPAVEEINAHMKKLGERLTTLQERSMPRWRRPSRTVPRARNWKTPSRMCRRRSRHCNPSPRRTTSRRSTACRS